MTLTLQDLLQVFVVVDVPLAVFMWYRFSRLEKRLIARLNEVGKKK